MARMPVVASGLSVVGPGTWAAHALAGRATPVETDACRLLAALEMTPAVPALVTDNVFLWQHRPRGYVIMIAAGTQASLYLLVLSVNSAIASSRGRATAPGEHSVRGTLLASTLAATAWLLFSRDAPDERIGPTRESPRSDWDRLALL